VYEVPRVFMWLAGIEMLLIVCCGWAVSSVFQNREFFKLHWPVVLATVVWLAIAFASSVYNQVLLHSLLGNYFRIDGLLTLVHFWLLAIMVGLLWPAQQRYYQWLTTTIAVSTAGISGWAVGSSILSLSTSLQTGSWPRAASISFGNPNLLAGFLIMTLPVWWFGWQTTQAANSKLRSLIGLGAGLTCLALAATQASSALLGIGVWLCLVLLLRAPSYPKIGLAIMTTLVASAGFWGIAFYQGSQHFEAESRYRIAHKLSLAIADKPWLGWGWSRVSTAFEAHPWPQAILHDVYVDKAHSHFLEMITTTGLVGLTAYLLVLGFHIWIISKKIMSTTNQLEKNWLVMWLVIVLLFMYHSQTNVISIQEELFFWLSLGMVSLPKPNPPRILDSDHPKTTTYASAR
jgi:O-antigen ligase